MLIFHQVLKFGQIVFGADTVSIIIELEAQFQILTELWKIRGPSLSNQADNLACQPAIKS